MIISSSQELKQLRQSGTILASILEALARMIEPGVPTESLEKKTRELAASMRARPSFLGFKGYPNALCVSVNEEVVHGMSVPSRILKNSDLVSLDLGIEYEGFFTDAAVTIPVGVVSKPASELIQHTKKSLAKGLAMVRAGATIGDIGFAIQNYLEPKGYGIVTALVGHGVGGGVHELPEVPNLGSRGKGARLVEGMVLAIEPMVSRGSGAVDFLSDGWTVVTRERCLAAHFEHTVVVTKTGCEILTSI